MSFGLLCISVSDVCELRNGPITTDTAWVVLYQSCKCLRETFLSNQAWEGEMPAFILTPDTIQLSLSGRIEFARQLKLVNHEATRFLPSDVLNGDHPKLNRHLEAMHLYSLGACIFWALNYNNESDESISADLTSLLTDMCEQLPAARLSLESVFDICTLEVGKMGFPPERFIQEIAEDVFGTQYTPPKSLSNSFKSYPPTNKPMSDDQSNVTLTLGINRPNDFSYNTVDQDEHFISPDIPSFKDSPTQSDIMIRVPQMNTVNNEHVPSENDNQYRSDDSIKDDYFKKDSFQYWMEKDPDYVEIFDLSNPVQERTVEVIMPNYRRIIVLCDIQCTIQDIADVVFHHLGIVEHYLFGLCILREEEEYYFLDYEKPLADIAPESWKFGIKNIFTLHVLVKFYSEDVALIRHSRSRVYFYWQLRRDYMSGKYRLSNDKALVLAALALLVENPVEINPEQFIPQYIFNTLALPSVRISLEQLYQANSDLTQEEALGKFLLDSVSESNYGYHFYNLYFLWEGSFIPVNFGISMKGVGIWKSSDDNLNSISQLSWSEVKSLGFKKRKFLIEPIKTASRNCVILMIDSNKKGKYLLQLAKAHHKYYINCRRNNPIILEERVTATNDPKGNPLQHLPSVSSSGSEPSEELQRVVISNGVKKSSSKESSDSRRFRQFSESSDPLDRKIRQVRIEKDIEVKDRGIGMSLITSPEPRSKDFGIFVSSVEDNSAAMKSGQIFPGDRLIAVNSRSIERCSKREAELLICQSPQFVDLIISQSIEHYQKAEAKKPKALSASLKKKAIKSSLNYIDESSQFSENLQKSGIMANSTKCSSGSDTVLKGFDYPPVTEEEKRQEKERSLNRKQMLPIIRPPDNQSDNSLQDDVFLSRPETPKVPAEYKHGEVFTVELMRINGGLGFTLFEHNGGVFVKTLYPNGSADQDGRLLPGDRVVEIHGENLSGKDLNEAIILLKSAPQVARFRIQRWLLSPDEFIPEVVESANEFYYDFANEANTYTTELKKDPAFSEDIDCIGLTITGCSDAPEAYDWIGRVPRVKDVYAHCSSTAVISGDILLNINNQPVHKVNYETLVYYINKSTDPVHILFCRPPKSSIPQSDALARKKQLIGVDLNEANLDTYVVNLVKPQGSGLGFSVSGGAESKKGCRIKEILVNPAKSDTNLAVGDRLLSVNGTNIQKFSHREVVQFLRQTPCNVTLKLARVNRGHSDSPNSPDTPQSPNPNATIIRIILHKLKNEGLGIVVSGQDWNSEEGVIIKGIQKQSVAARDGRLRPSDKILQINGESVIGLSYSKVHNIIRKLNGPIVIEVLRQVGFQQPSKD